MNETPAQAVTRRLGVLGVKDVLKDPSIAARIKEILGKNGAQFTSSLITVCGDSKFDSVEPRSIVGSAMIAATLDLPIEKSLGFAHIVPYKGRAQFQIGYKGLIQLALRSGQYAGMNAIPVNFEAFGGYDEVGDPVIAWDKVDREKDAVGYVFAWKLVSGFHKAIYWQKKDVEAHAKRFSQAYRGGYDTPWKTDFDRMALKTVIKDALGHWGILSVQMHQAIRFDQATVWDIGAEPEYIDATAPAAIDARSMMQDAPLTIPVLPDPGPPPTIPAPDPSQPTPFARRGIGRPPGSKNKPKPEPPPVTDEATEASMGLAPVGDAPPPPTVPVVENAPTAAPLGIPEGGGHSFTKLKTGLMRTLATLPEPPGIPETDPFSPVAILQGLVEGGGHSFTKLTSFLSTSGFVKEADTWAEWSDVPVAAAEKILASKTGLMRTLATLREPKPEL